MTMGYIEAIGSNWTSVQCHTTGTNYEDLIWDSGDPIPSKEILDAYISNNSITNWKITKLAFRNRFTPTEKVDMDLASIDNPSAPIQIRRQAALLRTILEDLRIATYIDLSRPDTRAGVQLLEQYQIIGVGRATIILDTPPTEIELYKE